MRGSGRISAGAPCDKWNSINQVIRENKLAILALQETHLSQDRIDALNRLFGATITILGSADLTNPTGARGVAFAISNKHIEPNTTNYVEIIEGRAAALTVQWTLTRKLTIINIYAPDFETENEAFWRTLTHRIQVLGIRRPDVVMGDCNMVESSRDRMPPRSDAQGLVESLGTLKEAFDLIDGYRARFEKSLTFSYMQLSTGSQSRIDRAYISRSLDEVAEDWTYDHPGISTDHQLLYFSLANYDAPFLGKGRWTLPTTLMTDKIFLEEAERAGHRARESLQKLGRRTAHSNPQVVLLKLKSQLREAAKERAKVKIPEIKRKIRDLKEDLRKTVSRTTDSPDDENARTSSAGILQERIADLEMSRFAAARRTVAGNAWVMGESITKYWTKMNAAPKPNTVINQLRWKDPSGTNTTYQYTSKTEQMAEVAKNHYDGLQDDLEVNTDQHERDIETILDNIDTMLSTRDKGMLARKLTRSDIEQAIHESAANKAAGMDGIPAEIWKMFLKWDEKKRGDGQAIDIVGILRAAYNDIESFGTLDHRFAEGWICPIFKKKDRRDIANYRPITILNADYKIMTRALSNKLSKVIHMIVHPDQAGFIPGRKIFDHIRLTRSFVDYAEAEEQNGVIIALDQEKAYDRINHQYLWDVLAKLNFPENFMRTVKFLYENATSAVMINGEPSERFRITRGARQGDPMSCPLFDIAIEPLAIMIRKSSLRGFEVPGLTERLIAILFADDTTIYLSQDDDYCVLSRILTKWCQASRAKFNIEKTEYVPVGTPEFRRELIEGTNNSLLARTLPIDAAILKDGCTIRCLGARIGNGAEETEPWMKILETIDTRLKKWNLRRPSLQARKLIVGMEVGGRTQFLARAQGMPDAIRDKLIKTIFNFVWDGNAHPAVGRETLYRPVEEGGIGLLDLDARGHAMELVWLKDYLNFTQNRPKWATIADVLIARAVLAKDAKMDTNARINCFMQTWKPCMRGKLKLRNDIRRMVAVGQKYNLVATVKNPSEELKEQMPLWYHIGRIGSVVRANSPPGRCLREKHGVRTILDAKGVAARLLPQGTGDHFPSPACSCKECDEDRTCRGCTNPHSCAAAARRMIDSLVPKWKLSPPEIGPADNLSLTKRRRDQNRSAASKGERITFDPSITERGCVSNIFRIFGGLDATDDDQTVAPVRRPPRPFQVAEDEVEAYTDGSARDVDGLEPRAGAGIWYGHDDPRNRAVRVPGPKQTNQVAELHAIDTLTAATPPHAPLHVVSDSKYAISAVTKWAPKWEDKGWLNVTNTRIIVPLLARLRARTAPTTFRWVKGHQGDEGNEGADDLAKRGADEETQNILPQPDISYVHSSVKLSAITQGLAYKLIRAKRNDVAVKRRTTQIMVDRTLATMEEDLKLRLTESSLWSAIRRELIGKNIRDFIWKAMHGAWRVGGFWRNIPDKEHRELCDLCGEEESMEHILTDCRAPGQAEIWELVRDVAARKAIPILPISIGLVLGAAAITTKYVDDKGYRRADRFYRIVIPESAHLIWKIRCKRVIEDANDPEKILTPDAVRNKWRAAMARRMDMDLFQSRRAKGTGRPRKAAAATATWKDFFGQSIATSGFLVGRSGDATGIG